MGKQMTSILVIEDNPGDERLIQELLKENKNFFFNLKSANRLKAGLDYSKNGDFDVILLDLGLPDSQGLETFRKVHSQSSETPIIVLTNLDDETIAKTAVRMGAENYLRKGEVDSILLVRSINFAIERHKIMIELENKRQALEKSEKKYRESYIRAEFYKDLLSHDIANFLQSLSFATEISLSYLHDVKKLEKELKNMQEPIERAAKLIADIQKLTRIEENKPMIEPVAVLSTINDAEKRIHQCFEGRKINLQIESPPGNLHVQANSLLIDVFENILHNAVKHNQNSLVEISIRISEVQRDAIPYLQLEFIDNGIGIPDNRKDNIFQRAFQMDRGLTGLGIGLSLVKIIVASYKGQVWVEDKVPGDYSKGSNVIVQLPRVM